MGDRPAPGQGPEAGTDRGAGDVVVSAERAETVGSTDFLTGAVVVPPPSSRPGVAHRIARALPLPAGAGMSRTLVERNLRAFRHGWITVVSGFFEPVFYLFSLGIGLGALIGDVVTDSGVAVPYASFVAPALLAASAMNGAVYDSTFNIFFKLKYLKLYDSVLSTPLGPRDIAIGEVTWALMRGQLYAVAFLLVMLLTGLVESWWALATLPAAALIGFAFAAAGMAATTYMRTWVDFDYVQLAILPMFLFSATFYPLSTYGPVLAPVVQATPLYHGVELVRGLVLGDVGTGLLWHVAYLVALGLVGLVVTARRLERLLLS